MVMRRLFGSSKPAAPTPTLEEATKKVGERADGLDAKVKKLDEELIKYREQLKKLRPNSPAANAIKARAMRVLKQKKMYETQREQLYGQSFNMEQAAFATQSMQDTVTTVTAMKQANQTLKTQFKSIKVNEIEDIYDDMQDMLDDANEIQDLLGRSFATPDEVDEGDLENELEALGDALGEDEAVPSFLSATAAAPTGEPTGLDLPTVPAGLEGVAPAAAPQLSTGTK